MMGKKLLGFIGAIAIWAGLPTAAQPIPSTPVPFYIEPGSTLTLTEGFTGIQTEFDVSGSLDFAFFSVGPAAFGGFFDSDLTLVDQNGAPPSAAELSLISNALFSGEFSKTATNVYVSDQPSGASIPTTLTFLNESALSELKENGALLPGQILPATLTGGFDDAFVDGGALEFDLQLVVPEPSTAAAAGALLAAFAGRRRKQPSQ